MLAVRVGGAGRTAAASAADSSVSRTMYISASSADRELGDGVARVQPVLHQSLPAERLEAFTHRDGADAEQLGDVAHRDRRTGWNGAVEDHPAQFVDDGLL